MNEGRLARGELRDGGRNGAGGGSAPCAYRNQAVAAPSYGDSKRLVSAEMSVKWPHHVVDAPAIKLPCWHYYAGAKISRPLNILARIIRMRREMP